MSQISDIYEQIKQQQYLLVKTKLQEAIKNDREKRNLGEQERKDYQFSFEEIGTLIKLFEEHGLKKNIDFLRVYEADYPDSPDYMMIAFKVDDGIILILADSWNNMNTIPTITNRQEMEDIINHFFGDDIEDIMDKINSLSDIDIDQIEIHTSTPRENQTIGDEPVETYKEKTIEARENLIKAKLRQTLKDLMEGKKQSSDNSLYRDNEIHMLLDMLKKAGFEQGKDFYFEEEPFDYNETSAELKMIIGNHLLQFSEMNSVTDIMTIQELEGYAKEDEGPNIYADWLKLKPIELEKLGISMHFVEKSEQNIDNAKKDKSIGLEDFVYGLDDHKAIEDKEHKIETDYISATDLEKEFIEYDKEFSELKQCKTYTVKKKDLEDVLDEEFGNYNADILYLNEDIEDVTVMEGIDEKGNKHILYYYPYFNNEEIVRQIRTFNENGDIVSMTRGQMKFNDEGLSEYDDIDSGSIVYKYDENGKKTVGLYVDDLIGAKYFEYDENGKIKLSISEESVEQHIKDGEKNYTICDGYFEPTDNGYELLPAKSMQEVEENEIKRYIFGDISKEEKKQITEELTPERQKRVLDILKEMEPLLEYCNTYNSLDTEDREIIIDDLGGVFEKLGDTAKIRKAIEKYTGYSFEQFISETKNGFKRPKIVMGDGVSMSVQASSFHYCEPRRSGLDSYESYEVGYPSEVIEQLRGYEETPVENDEELLESIYSFVPAEILSQIVMEHGGIDKEATLHPEKKLAGYKEEKEGMQSKNQKAADLINELMAQIGNVLEDYGKDEQE